jgi:hypothetical protein
MSKKALFITSQPSLYELSNIFLNNSEQEVECVWAESLSKSVEVLNADPSFDLVFVGHKLNKDIEIKELTKCLVPMINNGGVKIFGSNKAFSGKDFAFYYNELVPISKILLDMYRSLELGAVLDNDFISFPLNSLDHFKDYPFDCFLKIKKNDKPAYIQIFREKDEKDQSDVDKYKNKGAKVVYVSLSKMNEKIEFLEKLLKSEIGEELLSDPDKAFEASAQYSLEILRESGLDISESTLTRNTEAYNNTKHLVKNSRGKNDLKSLMSKNDGFYFKHVSMTSLMCCYILDELLLTEESNRQKLCSAAYFQNIYLENEAELRVSSNEELEKFDLDAKKRICNHPMMAFDTLSKNPLIDSDVLKLVKEQHGDKRGMTYPDMISSSSKMSLIFQIASLFSQRYLVEYESDEKVNPIQIFNHVASKLNSKDQEILNSFREVATTAL